MISWKQQKIIGFIETNTEFKFGGSTGKEAYDFIDKHWQEAQEEYDMICACKGRSPAKVKDVRSPWSKPSKGKTFEEWLNEPDEPSSPSSGEFDAPWQTAGGGNDYANYHVFGFNPYK